MSLLHDLEDGKKHEISEEDFDYFLDALPPVAMAFRWNNEKWHWGLAQAFYRGDSCFINQVDAADEWLAIKQDKPFESISLGRIIRDEGRDAAQVLLDRLRKAPVERCRELDY